MLRIFENGVMPALVGPADRLEPAATGRRTGPSWSDFLSAFGLSRDGLLLGPSIVSMADAFTQNVWVRVCVEAGPITLAQLPFVVHRGQEQLEPADKFAKPLYDLFAHPNEELGLSLYQLLLQTFIIRELYGEAFWLLERPRPGAFPNRIWIYHPWAVQEMPDMRTGKLLAWQMQTPDGNLARVDPVDVAHFPRYDPLKHIPWRPGRGTSALVSAGLATSADLAAVRYNLGFFDRGLAPGGVITTPEEMEPLSAEQFLDRIRARLVRKYGEPLLLTGGAQFTPPTATAQNAQLTESRKMNREEIAAAFKVPPFVVGIADEAKYANAKQFLKNWWQVALLPVVADFCSVIQQKIIRDPNYTCTLSTEGVEELQEARTEKVNQAIALHKEGIPWNVIDTWMDLGIGEFPGYDRAFVPFNVVELDAAGNEPASPVTPAPTPDAASGDTKTKMGSGDNIPTDQKPRLFSRTGLRTLFESYCVLNERALPPFDYASTQINLNGDTAAALLRMSQAIPDEALAEKGREDQPHVTIKYGIDPSVTKDQIVEALASSDSIIEMVRRGAKLTFGKTAVFAGDEYDVVYVAIDSPDLILLNRVITGGVESIETQNGYVPHATLAYVAPGMGEQFAGQDDLSGTTVRIDVIQFSGTDGQLEPISLNQAIKKRAAGRGVRDIADLDRVIADIISLIRGDDGKLQSVARGFYSQAIETGAQQIADLIGVNALISISNQRVVDFLKDKENLIVSVNETTANRIADLVREMVGEGATAESIGREIRDLYNLRDEQANLIGRQEVGSALNGGRYLQMEEEGVTQQEWLSSRDSRVRESHAEIDGEIVDLGASFSNGLAYPQDPSGPPEETINCRCVSLPVTNGEGRAVKSRTRIADRAEYWRSVMDNKGVRTMQKRMTEKLQAYLYAQRKRVIKALVEAGVAA